MSRNPQKFNIDALGNVDPTGAGANGAEMSVTPCGKLPWQGYWHTASQACDVILPANVWDVAPDPGATTKTISLAANERSAIYALLPNAPLGMQAYTVVVRGLVGQTHPTVVVNP